MKLRQVSILPFACLIDSKFAPALAQDITESQKTPQSHCHSLRQRFPGERDLKPDKDEAAGNGTPDGLPPPLEDVCDQYSGRAKGLCTACCEAQDCELQVQGDEKRSCLRLRQQFWEATRETSFPCDQPGSLCPCWNGWRDVFDENTLIIVNLFHNIEPSYQNQAYSVGVSEDRTMQANFASALSPQYSCNVNLKVLPVPRLAH